MLDRNEVLAFIRQNDFTSTQQLCERFHVSESTVRRMLDKLDAVGLITRIHGGAMSIANPAKLTEFQRRNRENKEQKIAIARAASELVNEHDTVILMGGTTVCEMCQFIFDMHITVISNSILVLNNLRHAPHIRLIMLGGLYNYQEEELGGLMGNSDLPFMRANWMFMGASGFDERFGFAITNASPEMYRNCVESSLNACVLADSSKYMSGGTSVAASLEQVSCLITDEGLNMRAKEALEAQDIKVILAGA